MPPLPLAAAFAQLADRLSPRVAALLAAALQALADTPSEAALVRAYEAGGVDGLVAALLGADALDAALAPVRDAIRAVVAEGAAFERPRVQAGADRVARAARAAGVTPPGAPPTVPVRPGAPAPRGPTLVVQFDALNPNTVQAIRTMEGAVFTALRESARDGVRQAVADGLAEGINPRQIARRARDVVGLSESQARAVASFRADIETFHERRSAAGWGLGKKVSRAAGGAQTFAVDPKGRPTDGITERRLRDFRFDATLRKALTTGEPLTAEQVDRMVAAYTRKLRQYAAESVARTATLDALRLGQRESWAQAIAAGKIPAGDLRRYWKTAGDGRVRLSHRAIPGLNPRGVAWGEPFQTPEGPMMEPGGYNCRCVTFVRPVIRNAAGEIVR